MSYVYVIHFIPNVGDTKMHGVFSDPAKAWDAIVTLTLKMEICSIDNYTVAKGYGCIWVRRNGKLAAYDVTRIEMDKTLTE